MNNNLLNQKPEIQNVLFVSDLPNETTEEDLIMFFNNYHCTQAKVSQ